MKDDTEVERQRTKARELRGGPSGGGGGGQHSEPGGAPGKKWVVRRAPVGLLLSSALMRSELIPLPKVPSELPRVGRLSRGCQQRVSRRQAFQCRTNDCISALNFMAGSSFSPEGVPSSAQREVQAG